VRITTLGPLAVDGRPVRGERLAAVIRELAAARGRPVSAAALVDAVWDGDPPEDAAGAVPRRKPQPIKTFEEKLKLSAEPAAPRTYIYAKRARPDDGFRQFLERAKREGWATHEIDASHNPHITAPDLLMRILNETAAA
jgi:hypothetical protein